MTQQDIESGLRKLGLKEGDTVLLHSSLSSIGYVEGGADVVIDAFLAVVGPSGALVVPMFGKLGVVTETVRARQEAVCSIHPRASVAAIGGRAEEICRGHWKAETAHGKDTPYSRIADLGGYVCLLGVDQDRNTSLHTAEELLRLPYLRQTQEFTFDTPEGEVTKSWALFPGPHRDFIGLDRMLREQGVVRTGRIGKAVVRLMPAREMIDSLVAFGRRHPDFALCGNPNCADCVRQRAALSRDRFSREAFSLATAGSLAGRYVPEMVETCRAVGIDAVELDGVQGLPVQMMSADEVKAAVASLEAGGCEVTALRASAAPADVEAFARTATACGVNRLVLPLAPGVARHAQAVAEEGLGLSLYNANLGGAAVFELMSDLRRRGLEAGLTFSAANFAQAGEKPFLSSYSNRLKRFMDQLDVADCTFDGTSTVLAGGNAEIVELVSILRCSSFDGYLVLEAANRAVGGLADAAAGFIGLLEG